MQAAKINIGEDYAIEHKGSVKRLRVDRVETHRYGRNSVKSFVKGRVYESAENGELKDAEEHNIEISEVLGHYTEHSELVAMVKREQEERDRAKRERDLLLKRSGVVLARLLGVPVNNSGSHYRTSPGVRISYDQIEVDAAVLDKVLALGERLGITVSDAELEKAAANERNHAATPKHLRTE